VAFPYVADQNFEAGGFTEFDSEVDTENKLAVLHYTTLAQHGARLELPYIGAYAAHITLAGGTADAYLQEDDLYDLAAAGILHLRFMVYVKGLVMAASDRFTIFSVQSAGPTDEMTVSILNDAGVLRWVAAETGATAVGSGRTAPLVQDQWHTVELSLTVDSGAGNDGTAAFFLDGYPVGTPITALDQGAIIQARLGAIGIDAGTTAGHLLFDHVVADDTRVFPPGDRFGQSRLATKSSHLFVGPGQLQSVTLLAGAATDNALICYDTDEANTNAPSRMIVPELRNAQGASDTVTYHVSAGAGLFQRGCYVALSGTNPRAVITARQGLSSVGSLRSWVKNRPMHGPI
jgi:hypothetical protein